MAHNFSQEKFLLLPRNVYRQSFNKCYSQMTLSFPVTCPVFLLYSLSQYFIMKIIKHRKAIESVIKHCIILCLDSAVNILFHIISIHLSTHPPIHLYPSTNSSHFLSISKKIVDITVYFFSKPFSILTYKLNICDSFSSQVKITE